MGVKEYLHMENNLKHAKLKFRGFGDKQTFFKRLSNEWFYTLIWINKLKVTYFTLFVQSYVCLSYVLV